MTYQADGTGIVVHEKVKIGRNVRIGHCSIIGFGNPDDGEIILGDNVTIGAFCVVHFGAKLGKNVSLDHYSKIGTDSIIGDKTKILYGKHIYDDTKIGENCIIGGHVADRTIIEDNVTYMGEIAHSHRNATLDWDGTEEPSPIIYKGSVVGVNAIIIGGLKIGPCAYIGAGEIVRTNIGKSIALFKGKQQPISELRGFIKSRCDE